MCILNVKHMGTNKKVLITGASGFIGHALVKELINQGYDTWAGVRSTSKVDDLEKMGAKIIVLSCDKESCLADEIGKFHEANGKWDYIVHAAGVTKCVNPSDFTKVNYDNTRRLIEAILAADMKPEKFIYLSSLSIFGAIHEDNDKNISVDDVPQPSTEYGRSKLKAEQYIQGLEAFPYVILRPTGVYGPREKDYFMMAKSIKQHIDFAVGFTPQYLTFIYVQDVVQAVRLSIEKEIVCREYFISDGNVYSSRTFSDLIQTELGVKSVLHVKCPLFILKSVSLCAEFLSTLTGRASTLNGDKYKIMKQRNWRCDISPIENELGYSPEYDLKKGVKLTIDWYKTHKWL
jgi:dihydroflavonol-4-reductase